jgi:hypothetical protein
LQASARPLAIVAVALAGSPILAQQIGGGRRSPVPDTVIVPLPDDGKVMCEPDGAVAITQPGFDVAGSSAGSANGRQNQQPPPPRPPSIDASLATLANELINNSKHCLTELGFQCEPGTPPADAFNYVDTQVDIGWLATKVAEDTRVDMPLPAIVLRTNPTEGLVNLSTYF